MVDKAESFRVRFELFMLVDKKFQVKTKPVKQYLLHVSATHVAILWEVYYVCNILLYIFVHLLVSLPYLVVQISSRLLIVLTRTLNCVISIFIYLLLFKVIFFMTVNKMTVASSPLPLRLGLGCS